MKFYLVDDDESVIRILTKLIENTELGDVIGWANDGQRALREILTMEVDIVLVDVLMPKLDGVNLVNEIRQLRPNMSFIMVSQVTDEELVTRAYKAGIEFYINKPINKLELTTVVKKVSEAKKLKQMLGEIQHIFNDQQVPVARGCDVMTDVKRVLGSIGMLGEKGTNDIAALIKYLTEKNGDYCEKSFGDYCDLNTEKPIIVRQRMRRAIKKGLSSIAYMGIEDLNNEYFQSFVNVLFDYESIKAEIDYIKGKRKTGGKLNVDKFIEGLMLHIYA